MSKYTQKTLKKLKELGYTCDIVERFNSFTKQRHDAFGFIDILAMNPETKDILAVQSTGPSGHSKHKQALLENPLVSMWLESGGRVELWSWRKLLKKKGGKQKIWVPRIEIITKEIVTK